VHRLLLSNHCHMSEALTRRPAAQPPDRLAGMDGLRALAALTVVVSHCGLYALTDGTTGSRALDAGTEQLAAGVLLFFTLSGLLLYRPYVEAILGDRALPSWKTFARNRFLRLAPAYWLILVVTGLVLSAAVVPHPVSVLDTGSLFAHPGALTANALLLQNYHPSTFLTGIGPAWTLAVEVGFYITLPVVCTGVYRLGRRFRHRELLTLVPPVALLAIGLAGKALATSVLEGSGGWSRNWPSVLARSFVVNADLFVVGMVIAAVSVLVETGRLRLPRWWPAAALAAAAVAGAAALRVPGGQFTVFRYDQLGTVAAGLSLAVLVVGDRSWVRPALRALEWRPLAAVGVASYSLYLWHQPVIDWFRNHGVLPLDGAVGLAAAFLLVTVTSGILSAVTYRLVERPALRRKHRGTSAAPLPGRDAVVVPVVPAT
jgi:peptidoglycan/LPS O-acetylase OafA/YrhL